ncbi:hypothetical protein SprV_0902658500 [Sparganum proliferum]
MATLIRNLLSLHPSSAFKRILNPFVVAVVEALTFSLIKIGVETSCREDALLQGSPLDILDVDLVNVTADAHVT